MKTIRGCLKFMLSAAALAVVHAVRADEPCHVDVMFAIDAKASAYVQDEMGTTVDRYAAHQLEMMNTVLTNSGLHTYFQFRSVGAYELGFEAVRLDETKYLTRDVLEQATGGQGQWAKLHNERDNRGADIVSVIVDTGDKYGHVGDSNSLQDLNAVAGFSENAYSVVGIRSTDDWHALLHEVGHNFGAGHAGGADQTAPYSHGYYFVDGQGVTNGYTVMAYLKYDAQGKPIPEAPVFSSPDVTWKSMVAGDAATADNVSVIKQTYQAVSQWRKAADEPPEGAVGPYMTTGWHQHSPYNDFAPVIGSDSDVPCGCAATAAVQMFKYYAWPIRLGDVMEGAAHKYVDGTSYPFTLRFDGHNEFKWAKMNDQASANDVEGNYEAARATLWCDAIGAMDFRSGDSSAQFITMAEAMTPWFEKGLSYSLSYHGEAALWSALVASLDRKELVQVMLNGHQVVADGYAIESGVKKVHFNWGLNNTQTRWYTWDEAKAIPIIEIWTGFRPKKTAQIRPLAKKQTAGYTTVSWDVPKVYENDITGFKYTRYVEGTSFGDYTGDAGTIVTDCADNYYQPGIFGIKASSKFDYTMTSYYVKGLKVELQARFDCGEWVTIDTPTLSDREDSKDGDGEVAYTKSVDLSGWSGKVAEFRFKASRTGETTTSSARISFTAPKVKNVNMPMGDSNTIPGGGTRSFNFINTSDAGKAFTIRIEPMMTGGVKSEPVAVMLAATGETVPARPSVASIDSLSSPMTNGFQRTCGLGKSVFFVTCNETTDALTASSSHLALVDDGDITVTRLDQTTWAVAIDAPQGTVPAESQLILTLCAADTIGNEAYRDLQLTFRSGAGGAEPEDTLAAKIADPDANFLYLPSGTTRNLGADDTHYVAGRGTVVFDGGLPTEHLDRGFTNQDAWKGTVKFTNYTPTADDLLRISNEFRNVNSQVEFVGEADPNAMYHNALSAADEEVKVARGTYGEIVVPAVGYYATAFDALTSLDKTADNTYADIIKDGTYLDTHTVVGWFRVGELPTGSDLKTLYLAKSCDGEHNGYKVAVDADGKLLVGKIDYNGGAYSWHGSQYKITDNAVAEPGKWFHLAVAIAKTDGAKTVTPTVFVNGAAVAIASGTFEGNLNGNGCTDLMVGAGVTAAGIYVDRRALADAATVAALATDYRYVSLGTEEMPEPTSDEPLLVWQGAFARAKDGWLIDVNGNTLAEDGNSITLNAATDGTSKGVKLSKDGLSLASTTVLVRYSDYASTERRRAFVAFSTASQADRWGLGLNAKDKLNLFRGTDYDYYTGNDCAMAEAGTFGVTVVTNGDKCAYVPLAAGGSGVYSRSIEPAAGPITGFTLGGISGTGKTGKIGEYDNLSATITGIAVFDRALTQREVEDFVWPAEPTVPDSISVNVIGGNASGRTGKRITSGAAGVCEVSYENWNQLAERSDNNAFSLTTNCVREVLEDGTVEETELSVTLTGKCAYTCGKNGTTPNGALLYGYIDDGNYNNTGRGAGIEIAGIPYSEYTLYVYFGSDGDGTFGPVQVNGTWYPAEATAWGSRATARSADPVLTEGQNYLAITGLTASELAVFGSVSGQPSGTRCGIAGFQIVNTGVRRTPVPKKDFAYEPKAGAKPTGWLTSFGEPFQTTGAFRIGPDGECVSVVSSGQHPYAGLTGKSNYTFALYADLSRVSTQKTGCCLVELGTKKNNGITQGLVMLADGNVNLIEATGATVRQTAVKTSAAPAAGYHLLVWTQSTTDGATLYVDGVKIGTDAAMMSGTSTGFQLGSVHGGMWNSYYEQAIGMAVAGAYGWDCVLTDEQVALLAKDYPFVAAGCEVTSVDSAITGTLTLVDGDTVPGGTYGCAFAVAAGATVDLLYDGEIKDGAQILSAKSVSADGAAFTVNGEPLPEGFEIDCANGKIVIAKVRVCELTGLHIAEICGKPTAKDPNGRESGWVELVNYGPGTVNLKDYKLYRLNYGKKDKSADAKKMLDREVKAGERTLVYMSEDYETAEDYGGDGVTIKNFGDIMVIPTKVNPKKYPSVILYDVAGNVIDKVVVPCELDDDGSVLVGITTNKLERYVSFDPRPLQEKSFATAIPIGPEVNGLYGKKDYLNDLASLNCHTGFAAANAGFTVRMPINPACESKLAADKIKSVRLIYRVFDPAGCVEKSVAMKSSKPTADEENLWGKKSGVWEGEIPAEDMVAGKLVQYAAMITDGSGAEWRAPRFVYPELGYEWYGVVVDPGEAVKTDKLQTFLMFIDNANKAYMDKDASEQEKYLPHCARMAIYDTQTHTYYDNVRIDLRGNTSKGFTKKSHGLRFNKVAPLVCTDPTTGEELEVRKTSFIAEFADPTYMRQMLSFWMLRDAGCLVPFDYPVRVYLNGAYYQLAFHSERFSDDLIENVYKLNQHVYSYKNIGTFGGATSAGGIEKKTPDDDNEKDLALLNAYCARFSTANKGASLTEAQKAALDKTVVTNFDIAAWINYIAATRISSECDDVWANLSGYIDKYDAFYNAAGDDMMYPLAYDMNLSWGQHYRDGGMGKTGLKADKDWFKSHPYYGGFVIRAHPTEGGSTVGNANCAYETILQNPRNREMLVRRLRTLMDKYLGAPGTPKEETPLWQKMQYYRGLMAEDAAVDRAKWPIDSSAGAINNWPTFPAGLDEGLEDLWTNYIEPRRVHLYGTHSVTNTAKAFGYGADLNAGIPLAQAGAADLKGAIAVANLSAADGLFHDEEVLALTNRSDAAVDVSGWQLKYSVACTLPGGSVIPAKGCVYVPANRRDYVNGLVAAGEVDDQIVLASADFKVSGAIALIADDGTEIVKAVPPTGESEYLRLHSFCGNTAEGEGDVGEWFVLTNISNEVALDLTGVTVCFLKDGDPEEGTDHCHVTFGKGTIKAGEAKRFDQADYAGKGWVKIQNNKLNINLYDSYGSVAQTLAVAQKDYPEAYGGGGWLVADSTAKVVGKKEWHVETAVVPVTPGEGGKTYETEEAATKAAAKAVVLRPENEVTNVIDAASYAALFDVKAVQTATSTWELRPELKPSVSNDVQAAVNAAVDEQLVGTLTDKPTATVTTQSGLYYGMAAAAELGDVGTVAIPFARWVLGNGKAQELTAEKPSEAAGFYRIRVQATPPPAAE